MKRTQGRAYSALLVSAIGWALAPVFIRYLTEYYDPYVQSFARYISAAATLVPYCLLFYRKELVRVIGHWRALVGISLLVVFMQTAWTLAIYHTTATSAQLIAKLQVPMVILLSYLVFSEERSVIRIYRFLLGTLCCFFGVCGVLMRQSGDTWLPALDLAFALLIFVDISWAFYIVGSRHTCKDLHPVPMFTIVSVMVSIGFLPALFLLGDPHQIPHAGAGVGLIAFISGVVSISISHCTFHYAQVRLGAAFCTTLQLINPLATYLIALPIWPDESMNILQWIGSAILIAGSVLVVDAQRRSSRIHRSA